MSKYVCSVCGYVYDEEKGIPASGIKPGTRWQELPESFTCPLCGAAKSEFRKAEEQEDAAGHPVQHKDADTHAETAPGSADSPERRPSAGGDAAASRNTDLRVLHARETSALCSNLYKGCEKQYMKEEMALFAELAAYFSKKAAAEEAGEYADASVSTLLSAVEQDLAAGFSDANAVAQLNSDRGALRALTWSEKVSRVLRSLLGRYEKEGDAMLQGSNVYVCTICGFVYIGDNPPELCPVCKVPGWKFEKIEGRA